MQARSAIYFLKIRVDQDVGGVDARAGHERARRLTERIHGGTVRADHIAQPASCSGQLPVLEQNVDRPAVRPADVHADGSRLVDRVHKPVNSSLDLPRVSRARTVAFSHQNLATTAVDACGRMYVTRRDCRRSSFGQRQAAIRAPAEHP